ncbi:hypothetical protein LOTGIDRAFT_170636 [Lottia gigantea]|uniref:DNA repair protein REV1 n=1 Tax=Lottia gigantea TaxID=225164 RepID=V4AK20_LOTGI|nr:hypothetical protein LOTGIDRAFT_170636 [Lottia gigantea]ESP04544.1 hypothetical protein LOTGIDRAFT_170636 [Lottia gigantea]
MASRGRGKDKLKKSEDGWEEWGGYMKAKQEKLRQQYAKNGLKSEIFKGISIYVNGYTKPSSDELKRMVIENGGMYQHYLYKLQVTHIIATSMANSKISKDLKHMKIVKPEWITDSISCGKLLSYIPYQLFTAQSRLQSGIGGFSVPKSSISTEEDSEVKTTVSKSQINQYRNFTEDVEVCPDSDLSDEDDSILGNQFEEGESDGNLSDNNNLSEMFVRRGSEENGSAKDNNHEQAVKRSLSLKKDRIKSQYSESRSLDQSNSVSNLESPYKLDPSKALNVSNTGTSKGHSPAKMAKAGDSNFLSEFYGNSRLHHLSTWGAEWKAYVTKLQSENSDNFPGRDKLREFHQESLLRTGESESHASVRGRPERVIMHIDMDCFFVSVGLLDRPDLRGKPVGVTHSKNKGMSAPIPGSDPHFEMQQWHLKGKKKLGDVYEKLPVDLQSFDTFTSMAEIASCSYEARKAGVKNGMFMGPAKKLCPELQTIPYNFEKYQEISTILYDTVASYTHDIEAVSCDEMLVDCTDLLSDTGVTPLDFTSILRQEIYTKSGCTASTGLGSNVLLAKLATRNAKPNGQYYVESYDVLEFIKDVSVRDLPGVGWSMNRKLSNMNVKTCGDLQSVPLSTLQKEFGSKTGQSLYNSCRGIDDRPIKMENERKSVSAEINYGIRFQKEHECVKFFNDLSEEVHNRLQKVKRKGKVVTLKLKVRREDAPKETAKFMGHGICNSLSRSITLPLATDDASCIAKESLMLLHALKVDVTDLRGIGIQVTRLEAEAGIKSDKSACGHQSILNFTVAQKTSPDKPAGKPIQSPNKSRSVKTLPTMVPKMNDIDVFLQRSSVQKGERGAFKGDNVPEIDSNAYKDFYGEDTEKRSSSLSQSLVEKHRITLMSGHTLVDELSRRKTAKGFLPPLPTLPSFTSPESTPSPPESGFLPFSTRSNSSATAICSTLDFLPSPSQIDQEVLKELPPDIRRQIEQEIKSKQPDTSKSSTIIHDSQEAGCSYWPDPVTTDMITRSPEDDTPIVALPSPSQIDLDCLNALPKELQDELKSAYKHQTTQADMQHKSPTKLASPSKSKKSPLFKVPKGRATKKRKLSPKKLSFSNKKSKSIEQKEVDHDTVLISIEDDVSGIGPRLTENASFDNENVAEAQPETKPVAEEINLCGAVHIKDVRNLLKEWLNSCPVPQEEDVEVITNYLSQLILDKNLELVDLVLKALNRYIHKLNNNVWRNSLRHIVNNTQCLIHSLHGSQLNIQYMKTLL